MFVYFANLTHNNFVLQYSKKQRGAKNVYQFIKNTCKIRGCPHWHRNKNHKEECSMGGIYSFADMVLSINMVHDCVDILAYVCRILRHILDIEKDVQNLNTFCGQAAQ